MFFTFSPSILDLFLFERVYSCDGSIVTKSGFDHGIPGKSRAGREYNTHVPRVATFSKAIQVFTYLKNNLNKTVFN